MKKNLKYGLNSILFYINIVFVLTFFVSRLWISSNPYFNNNTILLAITLCLQNVLFLLYEKYHEDVFIILFQTIFLIFFSIRILSLSIVPESIVLYKYELSPKDFNHVLIFILFANTCLFLGLSFGGKTDRIFLKSYENSFSLNNNVLGLLFIICLLLNFPKKVGINLGIDHYFIVQYVTTFFFDYQSVLLLIISYLLFQNKIGYESSLLLKILICYYIIIHGAAGGRGTGIENLCIFLFLGSLAIENKFSLSKKNIFSGILAIPLVFFIIVFGYFNRLKNQTIENQRFSSIASEIDLVKYLDEWDVSKTQMIFFHVYNRIGYLDHTVRLIKNKKEYSDYIHPNYYFKSITDNLLTPGSDIFDAPISNFNLKFIDNGYDKPTMEMTSKNYHSTIFTMYGETYLWFTTLGSFGILGSLFAIFLTGYIFKIFYNSVKSENIHKVYLYRSIILYFFYVRFITFGLDWDIIKYLGCLLTLIFIFNLTKKSQFNKNSLITN